MPLVKGITPELPEVIGETGEWEAYVRTRVKRRRRDHLQAERVRHVTHHEIPGATRKNLEECSWVTGLPGTERSREQQPAVNAMIA
jgi:hypothetical protein